MVANSVLYKSNADEIHQNLIRQMFHKISLKDVFKKPSDRKIHALSPKCKVLNFQGNQMEI